eukprot:1584514-Pleurochrysis_carterae.AAC.1
MFGTQSAYERARAAPVHGHARRHLYSHALYCGAHACLLIVWAAKHTPLHIFTEKPRAVMALAATTLRGV